jgi:hypothetical protein
MSGAVAPPKKPRRRAAWRASCHNSVPTIPLFWRRFARVMRNALMARELDPQEKEFLNDE